MSLPAEIARARRMSGPVSTPDLTTVGALPTATAALKGSRATVSDATLAYTSTNVGAVAVGGGSNASPVYCTGTAWVIG